MIKKVFSGLCYFIAILFLVMYMVCEINSTFHLSELGRIFILCGSCLFLYFGGFLLSKVIKNNKPMKINLWIFFSLYLLLFITLTLFDISWGRNGFKAIKWSKEIFNLYIENNFNIVPFKTIINYLKNFDSLYSNSSILYNLLGNFVACMPFAFFIPLLFKKQNKSKTFLITITLIVLGVELTQFLTLSGSCDIDDFILNISGALIFYLLIRIKSVNLLIRNIFLLENNKVDKKSIIKIATITFIMLVCFCGIIKFKSKLYDKNLDEYNKTYHPTITFEYSDTCSDNNLFYEDKIYKYYFECYDRNDFNVIINNEEKFKIEDLLNDSKYNVDIDRILGIMDYYRIKYRIENKYTHYELGFEINDNTNFSIPSTINNEYVEVALKYIKHTQDNINLYDVNFIPLKTGNTTIEIKMEIFDDDGNELKPIIKKIQVSIDKDLKVNYKEIN